MENTYIEYLRNVDGNDEFLIEEFWLEIRKDMYNLEPDITLFNYNLRRGFASAVIGEYAGIFIQVLITTIPVIESSIIIWEKISNHLAEKRKQKKVVRILNLNAMINLCKYDMMVNQNCDKFTIKLVEKLVDKEIENDYNNPDLDFPYDETLDKVESAKIIFENKKFTFKYIIASDGEITKFKKKKK